jgi:hypothetical protein
MSSGTYTFPPPVEYAVSYEDIDSELSTRNELAVLCRYRLRPNVHKISVRWKLKPSELGDVASHLSLEEFTLNFLDLTTAAMVTAQMYCSRKSAVLIRNDTNPSDMWIDYQANIIEM